MLKGIIYIRVFKDAGVRHDPSFKWPKVKGNLNLILNGEYTMIRLVYKVRDGVLQIMVSSNIIDSKYNIDNNELMLIETPTAIQVYRV